MRKYLLLVPLVLAFGLGTAFAGEASEKESKRAKHEKHKQAQMEKDAKEQGSYLYGKTKHHKYTKVRGKQGRKRARYFTLGKALTGDKKAIFEEYGYTPHRLRFNSGSKKTERWKYYELGLEFTFDDDSNLIKTRRFWPEDRRVNKR